MMYNWFEFFEKVPAGWRVKFENVWSPYQRITAQYCLHRKVIAVPRENLKPRKYTHTLRCFSTTAQLSRCCKWFFLPATRRFPGWRGKAISEGAGRYTYSETCPLFNGHHPRANEGYRELQTNDGNFWLSLGGNPDVRYSEVFNLTSSAMTTKRKG